MKNKILRVYDWFFDFQINSKRSSVSPKSIHAHNFVVVTTNILMWAYTFIAYFHISSPLAFRIGLVCSILHLLTPVLFHWIQSSFFISSIMLATGVIHQSSFAYYSGGFNSHILIWFGVIPLLGGVIAGNKAIKFWAIIVASIAALFFIFEINGYIYPNHISKRGTLYSHLLLIFGWISVSSVVLSIYNKMISLHQRKLEKNNNKLNNLLRILLHDMSNSIHVLNGLTNLYKDELDKENQRFQNMKRHTDFLANTISSIKSMYVINSFENEIHLKAVDLNRSIQMILSILENKISQKQLTINYNYNMDKKIFVKVSPHIFENQVLQNIFSNAIKFSHPRGIIDIKIEDSDKKNWTKLIIKDYGIGMSKETQKKIFHPEQRITRQGTQNELGTGLGMKILKSFLDKMNAEIQIFSQENQGTEVHLDIPMA